MTTNEEKAIALGNNRTKLRARLMQTKAVLDRGLALLFSNNTFDFANKRLVSDSGRFSLQWRILGVVGPKYHVLQNRAAFQWFQPFLDAKEAALHTAGSLQEGSRVWVLAKLNRDPLVIAPGDEVEKFILLSHGHDGTLAVRVGFTPIRVVCANTLALAHRADASKLIRVRHSASVIENLDSIRAVMNVANAEFEATAEQYRLLARKSINQADLRRYVKRVLKAEGEKISTRTMNMMQEIIGRCESGKGNTMPSVKNTYWTAYNGVNEWLAYRRHLQLLVVRFRLLRSCSTSAAFFCSASFWGVQDLSGHEPPRR